MKKIDSKGKSSVRYIGKGVIIVSIVATSSLCFLLGFFVGKNAQPPAVTYQTPVVMPVASQQSADPVKQEAVSPQPQEPPEVQQSVREEVQASQPAQQDRQPDKTQPVDKAGRMQGQGEVQAKQETAGAKTYTVQAGAFRNASDADILKAKLNKKGYKASVAAAETKKHEKVYKVLVGEFTSKNDADLSSVRISKTEGLRTFVTIRDQE